MAKKTSGSCWTNWNSSHIHVVPEIRNQVYKADLNILMQASLWVILSNRCEYFALRTFLIDIFSVCCWYEIDISVFECKKQ